LEEPLAWFRPDTPADRVTLSNLLQVGVTIVVAVAAAIATLVATAAADDWETSVRQEIQRSAALLEDVRYVYGDEAPLGYDLALLKLRAQLAAGKDADTDRILFAAVWEENRRRQPLLRGGYERSGGGFDVPGRLADVRRRNAELTRLDPNEARSDGDSHARASQWILLATVPLVLLYLVADWALRRGTRWSPGRRGKRGTARDDVGLVPTPWRSASARGLGASVALIAWLAVVLLPNLQLHFDKREDQSEALAARHATQISTALGASGFASSFRVNADRAARFEGIRALARAQAALDVGDRALAAELAARAQAIARAMGREPTSGDGVDAVTRAAVRSSPAEARPLVREQNDTVSAAQKAGRQGTRVTLALLLAGLTLSLSAVAVVERPRRTKLIERVAAGVLAMSLLATASLVVL
jgi:hypothetical protein